MTITETADIVVVGSGPCGSSVALNLLKSAPELAKRTIVLEKAVHPRHKLCGGGLTPFSQLFLYKLGVDLDVPFLPIHEVRLRFEGRDIVSKLENSILIVRRDRFDAALVKAVREGGLEVREEAGVTGVQVQEDGVLLETDRGPLRAKVVVAADGAKSIVRRHLDLEGESRICRAIEVLTPENPETTPEFRDHSIVVDFSDVPDGLQGYVWDFPSMVEGQPRMNRGVFDSRVLPERSMADLKGIFARYLSKKGRNLEDYKLMGNPSRWFDPQAQISVPRVLLAGDAAGIEPLGGDGISCALGYGEIVAAELAQAFESGDFSFSGYKDRLLQHELGKHLVGRVQKAKSFYSIRNRMTFRILWLWLRLRVRILPGHGVL